MNMVSGLENVQNKIINIRSQQVILDADVAELYGVQTRDINKAVKNNPEKWFCRKKFFDGIRFLVFEGTMTDDQF